MNLSLVTQRLYYDLSFFFFKLQSGEKSKIVWVSEMLYNQRFSCETSPGRNPGKKHLLHCVHKRGCSFLVPFGRGCHTHWACSCAQHSDSAVTGLTSLLSTEQQLHRNTEKSTRTFFLFLTSSQCSYKQVILLQ